MSSVLMESFESNAEMERKSSLDRQTGCLSRQSTLLIIGRIQNWQLQLRLPLLLRVLLRTSYTLTLDDAANQAVAANVDTAKDCRLSESQYSIFNFLSLISYNFSSNQDLLEIVFVEMTSWFNIRKEIKDIKNIYYRY